MYTLAKELNIPPHELVNYPVGMVEELMLIYTEVKSYEAEIIEKAKSSTNKKSSKDGVNFG
tara:strand:+ start:1204 stop:1386 length:183 start_codon:yes stop_codon:yes gene_type:complete